MAINQFPQKLGIPGGNTASRPSNPAIGDTFYNGQLGILEIWTGSAWFPCSAPPGTPINIVATDTSTGDVYTSTAGKLSVAFTAGSGGGQPTNYNVYTTAGGFSSSGSASPLVITGLTPGTSYTTYAIAQNGFGDSSSSANGAAVAPSTLPEVRTSVSASNSGINDVTVTWSNGSNGGKNLTAITITPFLNGTTAQTSANAATTSSTSYTFAGLTAGSSYTFKVKATNANGTCADSTASGSVTIPEVVTIDYLVVAGGGGGGAQNNNGEIGGGGGAGGLRSTVTATGGGGSVESALSLVTGANYTVTVGAGGAARTNGVNSVFDTITSTGGGKGGDDAASGSGGSGGGGGSGSQGGASGTTNQGRAGGSGSQSGNGYSGGGGGGANTAGTNASGTAAGNGGAGVAVSITGSSVTYAGGGGGGARESAGGNTSGGTGGAGGGGTGGSEQGSRQGTAGTVNTGSGGGGGHAFASPSGGGAGGSGVVILRYTDTRTITIGAGLTGTESSASGGYKRATITAGTGNVSWA